MTDINGLTNPFENAVLSLNETQLSRQKRLDDYSEAISSGYEPPADILAAIAAIVDAGILDAGALAELESLIDTIMAEIAPVITSDGGGDFAMIEYQAGNIDAVTTVTAIDNYSLNDSEGGLSYSISGGLNAGLFSIDATTGVLTFDTPPDYDPNSGPLEVTVQVLDGGDLMDTQTIYVAVTSSYTSSWIGTAGDDTYYGPADNTEIDALGGNDLIAGDGFSVVLSGYGTAPLITGNDLINAGPGIDTVFGDAAKYFGLINARSSADQSVIGGNDIINGDEDGDSLYGDALYFWINQCGSDFGRTVSVTGGDDVIDGGGGDDTIYGDGASARALNTRANREFHGGNDTLNGGDGADTIYGDWGSAGGVITIGLGDDVINGGAGNDVLWGDGSAAASHVLQGADIFVFNENHGRDRIMDFQKGVDKIQIDAYGITSFDQIHEVYDTGAKTVISLTDDHTNDIYMGGVTGLTADDFLFA